MKSTGIVRKVDELGRIVIPMELRRTIGIHIRDSLEIYTDEDKIVLAKYEPGCVFCDATADVEQFKGKNLCASCRDALRKKRG
ncbi:MAG: AbrB/MazE/SpoVT family DNA-binding domain-containing protein [Actinobacteria bacterium]|nr:MAG: AbrB/MazE/SpoVT family DNA-binding domain-containing protein [Actinomycetota bacterium]